MNEVYSCTPIKPFIANGVDERDNTDFRLEGFQTTNLYTDVRLSLSYDQNDNVCCVAVTKLGDEGHHIFLPTDVLKDLIGQFSEMVEFHLQGDKQ